MDKGTLIEPDICTKFITPTLIQAGWDFRAQIREEVTFIKGRIIVRLNPIIPREWFLVPHSAIDEAVQKIKDGRTADQTYDLQEAHLKQRASA